MRSFLVSFISLTSFVEPYNVLGVDETSSSATETEVAVDEPSAFMAVESGVHLAGPDKTDKKRKEMTVQSMFLFIYILLLLFAKADFRFIRQTEPECPVRKPGSRIPMTEIRRFT